MVIWNSVIRYFGNVKHSALPDISRKLGDIFLKMKVICLGIVGLIAVP